MSKYVHELNRVCILKHPMHDCGFSILYSGPGDLFLSNFFNEQTENKNCERAEVG